MQSVFNDRTAVGPRTILSNIGVVLKVHAMYPRGHPRWRAAAAGLKTAFQRYFSRHSELTFGVGKGCLYLDDEELSGEEWSDGLAMSLHKHSISKITFHRGLTEREIETFFNVLRMDALELRNYGGHLKMLRDHDVMAIEVQEVDFQLQEAEIEKQLETLSDAEIWRKIARGLTGGGELSRDDQVFVRRLLKDTPRLATIIESAVAAKHEETKEAAQVFCDVVENLSASLEAFGEAGRRQFEDQVQHLFAKVSPACRYSLMDAAGRPDDVEAAARRRTVSKLLAELKARELAQGVLAGLETAPHTLENFAATYQSFVTPQREQGVLTAIESAVEDYDVREKQDLTAIAENVGRLPADPALENLRRVLEGASRRRRQRDVSLYEFMDKYAEKDPAALAQLSAGMVGETICENRIRILAAAQTADEYRFFADGFDELIVDLIRNRRYKLAEQALSTLSHQANNPRAVAAPFAREILAKVGAANLAEELVRSMDASTRSHWEAIAKTLAWLGEPAIETVFQALVKVEDRSLRLLLMGVLTQHREKIGPYIAQWLQSPQWYMVRNVVMMLRRAPVENLVDVLRNVVDHPEARVRIEAARTLVCTADPKAIEPVAQLTADEDENVRQQAILSLGVFKGSAAACKVLCDALARRKRADDARTEEMCLTALGKVKHPDAIPVLAKYLAKGSWFSRIPSEMRVAAAKSLAAIDHPDARQWLEVGASSKLKELQAVCAQLLAERGKDEA